MARANCPICGAFLPRYTPGVVDKCSRCGTEFDHGTVTARIRSARERIDNCAGHVWKHGGRFDAADECTQCGAVYLHTFAEGCRDPEPHVHPSGVRCAECVHPYETAELAHARAALDLWEHYADHDGFIAEVGGRAAYDAEHARLVDRFTTLNTREG